MPPGTRRVLAGLVASLTLVATPAVGQSAGALQWLGLAGYPPDTRPPGFSGATVDGSSLSLESLRSRVVLLNFWATWCLECRAELPVLERLHRDYVSRGLTVLAVNFREEPAPIRRYARELGLTMPLLLDSAGAIRQSYGVDRAPDQLPNRARRTGSGPSDRPAKVGQRRGPHAHRVAADRGSRAALKPPRSVRLFRIERRLHSGAGDAPDDQQGRPQNLPASCRMGRGHA